MSHRLLGFALTLSLMGSASSANPGRFYEDALRRYEKQDYEGAVVQLKNVLQADPKQLAAQLLLGRALRASSQVAAAEVAFREA
ncbi:MAG: tetratricopeptide repeat protein, partial [Inhella sp.]